MAAPPATLAERALRFFFMHLGSLVAVVVYFYLCGASGYSAEGVRSALYTALLVKSGYMAIAAWQGEQKQFDFGIWILFAAGTLAAYFDVEPVFALFRRYSPAILFATLGSTALLPVVIGREPFTHYYSRRQLPAWQLKTREFHVVSRVMALYWVLVFFAAAGLCAYAPRDPRFTFLFPNLVVFVLGVPAQWWLPPLFFKLFPPEIPTSAEALIMGMPMTFDAKAARGESASIQFRVSGAEPGAYWLRVHDGRCESSEGVIPGPDLTVHTPDAVWVRIAHGRLDGAQALAEGLFWIEGDARILAKMRDWFSVAGRRSSPSAPPGPGEPAPAGC